MTMFLRRTAIEVLLFAGLLGALGVAGAAQAQDAAARGNATNGKELFHAHGCYGCHGFNGETGQRDLVATGSPLIADEATFRMYLRLRGDQAPPLPVTRMPNYPVEALSDAQVRDIYAFVQSLRLNAPAVKDVPTLRAILDAAAKPPARPGAQAR